MATEVWRKNFWRNAATNYVNIIVRIGSGLVLFRLLFQHLEHERFGYYSLLWSLFGYAILLDFGLGVAVQKVVAQKAASGDLPALNRLVTTIVWSFAAIGLACFLIFAAGRGLFLDWIHVAPENRAEFGTAYLIFFAALAVNLPLALFHEMLRGLQRMDIVNWSVVAAQLLNLGLMTYGLLTGWPFAAIVLTSVATTVAPEIAALFFVRKLIPGLSLHPRNFHLPDVRGVLSFSIVAYLITFTNIVMVRSDQAVISFTIGVGFVALYQLGYKASEFFGHFSRQMQEALSPAAAHLHATGDTGAVRGLLVQSSRITILVTTPLYALCAAYLDPVIRILSGLKQVDATTFWVGEALLLATYTTLITSSCSKRIMVMCGWERRLLKVSLAEAGLNLVFSLLLVRPFGILGVAVGTLVPAVLIGWCWTLPLTAKFAEIGYGTLLREFFAPVLAPVLASLAVLAAVLVFFPLPAQSSLLDCSWRGLLPLAALAAVAAPRRRSLKTPPAIPAAQSCL